MTIIVSVKINNGIVIASDSTTSFFRNDEKFVQSYNHENKIFNLYKGLPIGGATCGAGNIGTSSISTLSKDLRQRFLAGAGDWKVDPDSYTIEEITHKVKKFLTEMAQSCGEKPWLTYWVFGYSSGEPLPELWAIQFRGGDEMEEPVKQRGQSDWGPNWAGQEEALDRLILGRTSSIADAAAKHGEEKQPVVDLILKIGSELYETLVMPAMPIQDAIDLAKYMVETTRGFIRFSIIKAKTVGGPTEIAAITKYEGFKWVARKHFYPSELNP